MSTKTLTNATRSTTESPTRSEILRKFRDQMTLLVNLIDAAEDAGASDPLAVAREQMKACRA